MLSRAVVVWLLLLIVAVANGAVRAAWLIPRAGDYWGHVISSVTLSALILIVAWATVRWIGPGAADKAMRIGGLWLAMTVAFEFLAGHFIFGSPWARLLEDYNLAAGRIWLLVLVTTTLAPRVALRLRGL